MHCVVLSSPASTHSKPCCGMRSLSLVSVLAVMACMTHGALACGTYTIQTGDTFWKLSQARGFSVDAILAANPGVKPEALQIGQTVNLPCNGGSSNGGNNRPQPQPQRSSGGCGTHTIAPGDTLWRLSQDKGFSVDAITAANPGVVPEALRVGQTVNLPCSGGSNNGGNRPQPQPQQPNGGSAGGSICNAMLPHVNAARGQAGLSPLHCSGELDRAAQRHSDDQARRDSIGHRGGDGSDIGDRINPMVNAMGCRKRGGISENVAQNRPGSSAKAYFDQWWGSAGHKQNILGRDATHMGVAVASNGRKEYATQVFAECR